MLTDDQIRKALRPHMLNNASADAAVKQDLVLFRAIEAAVIEACATECEARHANGNRKHLHPADCAAALREMKTC